MVGLVAAGLALAYVLLRLAVAADGDITRFVVAGEAFVDAGAVAEAGADLHVFPSTGYDGQFFWRLAADPTAWGPTHDGVTFDGDYRTPRLGYPLLAHLAAGGRVGFVAWSLVGVNVAAVGVAGHAAARLARVGGHASAWGLLAVGAPGLALALGRDLAECVTVACLLVGIAAVADRRPLVAAAAWSYAVFTREQALLTVGAYALVRLSTLAGPQGWRPTPAGARARTRSRARGQDRGGTGRDDDGGPARGRPGPTPRLGVEDLAWVVPGVVFVGWQAVLWRSTGVLPAAAAGGTNLVAPFSALAPGLVDWATGGLARLHAAAPLQLAMGVALVVAAARAAGAVPERLRFVVVGLGLSALAATCLAASIWRDPSDMRHLVDVYVLSSVTLVTSRRPPPAWAALAVGAVAAATLGVRILAV